MQLRVPNNVIISDSIKMFFGYFSKFEWDEEESKMLNIIKKHLKS